MTTGGSVCKDMLEATSSDYDASDSDMDIEQNDQKKKISPAAGIKSRVSSTNGMNELLQCPVCLLPMYPPILQLQCLNGHTLCSKCKHKVNNRCPDCRQELGNIRCLALERIAQSVEFPCKHQSTGCSEILSYYDKLGHEQHCRFRPYGCPYTGSECAVSGDIATLVAHLRYNHKVAMQGAPSTKDMRI